MPPSPPWMTAPMDDEQPDIGLTPAADVDRLMAEGWAYKDIQLMPAAAWEILMDGLGSDNIRVLACTIRTLDGGAEWRRGQVLISAEGRKRAADNREDMMA